MLKDLLGAIGLIGGDGATPDLGLGTLLGILFDTGSSGSAQ